MAATSSWGSAMGQAERRIEASYQKVVLAGYVVAVETVEAWRWLERQIEAGYQKVVLVGYVVAVETVEAWPWLERFVRAIKRQQRKPAPPPMF
jgi:hypothetical protein